MVINCVLSVRWCRYCAYLLTFTSSSAASISSRRQKGDGEIFSIAKYLHHLTDKTQFITITHRRGTMEEADVLYGVTMQEKGVSKLLKMDVSETRQMKLE